MQLGNEFKLKNCQVDVAMCTVSCGDEVTTLQPKFMEVLCYLALRYNQPVSRDELIDNVWDGNAYVGQKALTNAIWHLRKTFKQCDDNQEYIETLRKTGYRLVVLPEPIVPLQPITPALTPPAFIKPLFAVAAVVFVALFAWFLVDVANHREEPASEKSVYKITSQLGRELYPSVSPDGHWLLYAWYQLDEPTNLYKQNLLSPSEPAQPLTQTPYHEGRSVFSADMNSVFYYRKGRKIGCEVVQHSLLNDEVQVIDKCLYRRTSDVSLSANGELLAYVGLDATGTTNVAHVRDLLSGHSEQIDCLQGCDYRDEALAISPDGTQLVVSRNLPTGHEELFLLNVKTKEQKQVTSGFLDVRGLAWHPTQNKVTFSVIEQGRRQGYHLNIDSNELTAIDLPGFSYPHYAQNGDLYYHRWRIPKSIMHLSLDAEVASTPFPLLLSDHSLRFPAYSEVNDKVAYVSNETGQDELWLSNLNGQERKQLTKLGMSIEHPSWSHSGRYIAFGAFSTRSSHLFIYDMQTGRARQVGSDLRYFGRPNWSLDDTKLFVSDDKQLYQIDLQTNALEQLTQDGGTFAMAVDENTLLYSKLTSKRLWKLDLATKESTKLSQQVRLSSDYGWYYSNDVVYFFNLRHGDYRISRFDMNTEQADDLIRVQQRGFSRNTGLSYVPEKNWLLYSAYKDPQIDVMVYK
ncbi:winged helix-turn-helix domain-containing protein [Pseudoalteromonas pernae]|uniref:winged helix-turn-helix domain-containing protein n=1 Tax=Pseudoalteromonas pernae TaxID=3118054 RepID=UPI0032422201